MEDGQRRLLQRSRLRLVQEIRVEPLWDLLVQQGIFTQDMIEEIQAAVLGDSDGGKELKLIWAINESDGEPLLQNVGLASSSAGNGGCFLQRAGTRRDQARQLITDLQTRGKQAFPAFIWCLQETGQNDLVALLRGGCAQPQLQPADIRPVEVHVYPGQSNPSVRTSEYLPSPVQVVKEKFRRPARDVVPTQGSVEETSQGDLEMVYSMKTDPCGYCLIINNVKFSRNSGLSTRPGSDIDCKRLERRFRSLHFDVLTRRDLNAEEISQELQNLAKRDHSFLDCCLVVILSHGCQNSHIQFPGGIYGTDGRPISVERIVSYFNGYHCPSLRGKPKLFFIQACGGEQKDRGFEVDSDSSAGQPRGNTLEPDATPFQVAGGASDEPDAVASLPTPSDILVSYSTFPGFVSWRDKLSGSWYIETLDDVLEKHASSEHLQDMLLRVSNTVSAKGKYKQMPGCFNFLRKRFFFTTK